MTRKRLDQALVGKELVATRSQAESYIRLGKVKVNGSVVSKPGTMVNGQDTLIINSEQYVSRAGLKLSSVSQALQLDFRNKIVLDVGSSTGGFTDYALKHGAAKVVAVDVGTNQMSQSLRSNPKIELHEQTDIRNFKTEHTIDIAVIDVSFISLREILVHIADIITPLTHVVAMAKPQFEVGLAAKHKGVIKNDKIRRNTLKDLENWIQKLFKIIAKADSGVAGAKGNQERFYLLKLLQK